MRVLILGGSTEASTLARHLAPRDDFDPVLSLAGRTVNPVKPPIAFRVGGFGGAAGLHDFLVAERIRAVVDATHPFAARMSANAAVACRRGGVPLLVFTRPAWHRQEGDRWIDVDDTSAAVRALGDAPRRVLLTHGRSQLAPFAAAPQHHYVVRSIDRPDDIMTLPRHRLILARGPFLGADETRLLRDERIDILVAKNSGGAAAHGKIEAARALEVPVLMIRRPATTDDVDMVFAVDDVMAWLQTHRAAP
jgi:precorrin-6A/cobalt-precorrin-6A reductase